MKPVIPAITLLAFALSACNAERTPDGADAPPVAADATIPADPAAPPPLDQPAEEIPPATAPMPAAGGQAPDPGLARWDGYGDMRFGMSAEEAKQAWGGELNRLGGEGDPCYFLTPRWVEVPAELAFMIENDRFVRYGTESEKMTAPGGGRRGMSGDEIKALYPGRVDEMPHKYVEGGKYLNIKSDDGGDGKLVFEVGKDGKVTDWRVGVPPQVDYVEGCG